MFKHLTTFALLTVAAGFATACGEDDEIDICSDDIDCNDGFICEITGQDDGICVDGVTE